MRGQGSDCVRCTREISPPAGGDLLFPWRKRRQNAAGDAADGLRLRYAPPRSIGLPPYPLCRYATPPPDRGSRPRTPDTGVTPWSRQNPSGAQNLSDDLNSRRATGPWVCKNFGWCGSVPAPGFPSQRFRGVFPWAYHRSDYQGYMVQLLGNVKKNASSSIPYRSTVRLQKGTESQERRTGPAARRRLRGDIPAGTG